MASNLFRYFRTFLIFFEKKFFASRKSVLVSLGNVFSFLCTLKKKVPFHWVIRNYVAFYYETPSKKFQVDRNISTIPLVLFSPTSVVFEMYKYRTQGVSHKF